MNRRIPSARPGERDRQPTSGGKRSSLPPDTTTSDAAEILRLQRALGNRVVSQILQRQDVQPDQQSDQPGSGDPQYSQSPSGPSGGGSGDQPLDLPPVEQQVTLQPVEMIPMDASDVGSGPGDYELPPDPNVAMAKHIDRSAVVQRDPPDGSVKPRLDVGGGVTGTVGPPPNPSTGPTPNAPAPFTITSSVVLDKFDIFHIPQLNLDFGHEPSFQLQLDPSSGVSAQAAIALINLHWNPPWGHEVEASISPFVQGTLKPLALTQVGGQIQAEQHVTGTLSITLTATGGYQPPTPGQQGGLVLTGGAGVLLHFDWDKLF
jgi:hypothetical protein